MLGNTTLIKQHTARKYKVGGHHTTFKLNNLATNYTIVTIKQSVCLPLSVVH